MTVTRTAEKLLRQDLFGLGKYLLWGVEPYRVEIRDSRKKLDYLQEVAAYALAGALIESRRLPSIVVTLGLSFVWLGCAVLLLPTPGGLPADFFKKK